MKAIKNETEIKNVRNGIKGRSAHKVHSLARYQLRQDEDYRAQRLREVDPAEK